MIYPPLILSMLLMIPIVCCAKDENLLTIESWGNGAPELNISAPSGYTVEKHKGPDFDVHYVRSKNPNDPSMGIYIGHHPNLFSSQKQEIETKKEADVILGQNVEWILWQEKEDGKTSYHRETIVKEAFKGIEGGGVAGLVIHVFINGPDQKKVNLLKVSVKSLQIVRKPAGSISGMEKEGKQSIGSARMEEDGTIILELRAEGPKGLTGDALLRYPPGHPEYSDVLRHLGGLKKAEIKQVPPWF
jgi:hypothetical protein